MISQHFPILLVLLPVIASPACALLNNARLAWAFTTVVVWCTLAISIVMLLSVHANGPITYELGGWPPPWGIEYRLDILNTFIAIIVAALAVISLTFTFSCVSKDIDAARTPLFYAAFLLCIGGLLGILYTNDAFNIFVFLEISSLSSYALIAMGNDRKALTSAYDYLIVGTIGATFILIGIGLLYSATGTLNIFDLHNRIQELGDRRNLHAAFAFFTVGIFLKLALYPLHYWLPNAYANSPSVVSVFLAATATKVALYLLLRIFYTLFGESISFETLHLNWVLLPLSVFAVLASSAIAIFQSGLKRMLAYSSLANIGYMTLGISTLTHHGLTSSIVHLFNHAITKGALFMCAACIALRLGSTRIDNLKGIGKTMPWTMAAFVVAGLSLIGIPLTAGFVSKWYLILAAIENGWWWLVVVLALSSLMAVAYVWRVIEQAYFHAPDAQNSNVKEAPTALLIGTWLLSIATFVFGVDTRFTLDWASHAATMLMNS